jgi:hypothetical protein
MGWTWTKDSILNNINADIPPTKIFRAVAGELGRYYKEKGFTFTKSTIPKLTCQAGDIQLEIELKSSRYNRAGESVSLEIMPLFECLPYVEAGVKGQGILFDHTSISSEFDLHQEKPSCTFVEIFGGSSPFFNPYPGEVVHYAYMCDVYSIDEAKFLQIIRYIDNRIIPWLYKIQTASGVEEMIAIQRAIKPDWNLENSSDTVHCSFAYYICDRFPALAQKWNIGSLEEG